MAEMMMMMIMMMMTMTMTAHDFWDCEWWVMVNPRNVFTLTGSGQTRKNSESLQTISNGWQWSAMIPIWPYFDTYFQNFQVYPRTGSEGVTLLLGVAAVNTIALRETRLP